MQTTSIIFESQKKILLLTKDDVGRKRKVMVMKTQHIGQMLRIEILWYTIQKMKMKMKIPILKGIYRRLLVAYLHQLILDVTFELQWKTQKGYLS